MVESKSKGEVLSVSFENYMKFTLWSLYIRFYWNTGMSIGLRFPMTALAALCRGTKTQGHKGKDTYYLVLYRKYADS